MASPRCSSRCDLRSPGQGRPGDARAQEVDLLVVGAGAKAAALAAKAHVVNALGLGTVSVAIVERLEVAASWMGDHGYTSGAERLALTPMKDVGFPYESAMELGQRGAEVDAALLAFSWQSFLMGQRSYARWVDAGAPSIEHREYGRYLRWVIARARCGVQLIEGEVSEAAIEDRAERWMVSVRRPAGSDLIRCRALMLTGPGSHRSLPHERAAAPRVFDVGDRRGELARIPSGKRCEVAIVGGGESALSSLLHLRELRPCARLAMYTPRLPLSRGESFVENRAFSNPDSVSWVSLPLAHRRELIRACDRGVMGPDGLAAISYDERCRFVAGRVTRISAARDGGLLVEHQTSEGTAVAAHDYLVNCTGFDPVPQLAALLGENARAALARCVGPAWQRREVLERRFGRSLEVQGLRPLLHVPSLAAMSQGPGFSNLGCLGLMADRVLAPLLAQRGEGRGRRRSADSWSCPSARRGDREAAPVGGEGDRAAPRPL